MNIGDEVNTLNGRGRIEAIEHYSRIDGGTNRYGVRLDKSPFSYPVAYYWPKDVLAAA
jgi:hypothetical protein